MKDFELVDVDLKKGKLTYNTGFLTNQVARWNKRTLNGSIKQLLAEVAADQINWYWLQLYNDAGGFRKKDQTVAHRMKISFQPTRKLSNKEMKKLREGLTKIFKGKGRREVSVYIARDFGEHTVHWRTKACKC